MLDRPSLFLRVLDALLLDGASGTAALDAVLANGPSGEALINALRDPRLVHAYGTTPMCQAVWKRNLDAVQRLLEISPTLALDATMDGHTPLMIAARHKDPAIATALLPVSDLMAQEPVFQESVLEQIVQCAHESLMTLALPYLVNAPTRNDGQTFLMLAAAKGPAHAVRHLLPVSEVNAQDEQGRTALMLAVDQGAPESVRALLPFSNLRLTDHEGFDVIDRFWRMTVQDDRSQRSTSRDKWACLDLLGLFLAGHPTMVQLANGASPKVLPLWHDAAAADRRRDEIRMAREVPELRALLADQEAIARPRSRL